MEQFQNILVMGAGAVGGYFGGCIAKQTSSEVALIARGAHLEALQGNGLSLKSGNRSVSLRIKAFREPLQAPSPDLILFTVKSYDTKEAIRQISSIVSETTQILTLQNGIENYPKLVEAFGADHVIQGFCKIGAGVTRPGVVEHKAFGSVTVGEQSGNRSERVERLAELFKKAEVPITVSSDISRQVWLKFTWNCILNMVTAAANVTVDKIFSHHESEQLCYKLFDEIKEVAENEHIDLKPEDGKNIIESSKKLTGFETSTYQDRQKGKKMEYEAFTGAIVRLAGKHGLNVPHNETLYALLKLIDEKGRKE